MAAQTFAEIAKFNPYHDSKGRFAAANAATSFTYAPGKSTAHNAAIQREKEAGKEKTGKGFKGTLYHGSPEKDIKEFDISRAGRNTSSGEKLIFFTDSKQMAEDFSYERLEGSSKFFQVRGKKGRVYEVDVEMNNPLDFRNLSDTDIDNILKLDVDGILTKETVKFYAGKNHQLLKAGLELTSASLTELGYDGLIANTGKAGHNSTEYAVVDSKQTKILKSAPGSIVKTFDNIIKTKEFGKVGTREVTSFCEKKSTKDILFIGLKIENAEPLAIEGGENHEDFHITLAYGQFDKGDRDDEDIERCVNYAVDQVKVGIPDKIHFDAIGRFPASESSDGKDVIYAQVAAGQLEEAHDYLLSLLKEKGIELEDTFPEYKPHMTLAYIDPEEEYELTEIESSGSATRLMIGYGQDSSHENEYTIIKTDDDKRLVFGWASVSITVDGEQLEDRQKDMIDPEDLEEAAYEYVLNFRDTGEEHISTMRKKGKLVESCVFTAEKQKAMGIPEGILPIGWWIGFKIEDDAAWERVKNGTYKMFSIEGRANREPVGKSERIAKTFNDILKFNPYHGKDGRFTSAGASGGTASSVVNGKDLSKTGFKFDPTSKKSPIEQVVKAQGYNSPMTVTDNLGDFQEACKQSNIFAMRGLQAESVDQLSKYDAEMKTGNPPLKAEGYSHGSGLYFASVPFNGSEAQIGAKEVQDVAVRYAQQGKVGKTYIATLEKTAKITTKADILQQMSTDPEWAKTLKASYGEGYKTNIQAYNLGVYAAYKGYDGYVATRNGQPLDSITGKKANYTVILNMSKVIIYERGDNNTAKKAAPVSVDEIFKFNSYHSNEQVIITS